MLTFGIALVITLVFTPIVSRIATARNWVDIPGLRKLQLQPIPRVGGLAIMAGLLAGIAATIWSAPEWANQFWHASSGALVLLGAVLFMAMVGFFDDVRGLRARQKFAAQLLVAIAVCALDLRIDSIRFTAAHSWELGWVAWPLTIIWIVGVTNAINMIDGLDGLAAGIAALGCAALAIVGFQNDAIVLATMAMALCGAITGFLVFNSNPARIYMGDCGSLALGMFLAVGCISSLRTDPRYISFAIPLLAIGIPVLDAIYCIVRRIIDRRSPFSADQSHIHHRLMELGFGQRRAVAALYLVTLAAAGLGMFMLEGNGVKRLGFFFAGIAMIGTFFWAVGYVRFRAVIHMLLRLRDFNRTQNEVQRGFEDLQLQMREAASEDDWWKVICRAGEEWEFESIEVWRDRKGVERKLMWHHPCMYPGKTMKMQMPLQPGQDCKPLEAAVAVRTNGSLEASASRFKFFARLLDEYAIPELDVEPSVLLERRVADERRSKTQQAPAKRSS